MAKKKMSEGLENALQKLVDRLVERMEDASQSLEWNKPWIQTGGGFGLPRNISGSPYMGMNAFLLSLHAAENGYKMPIYMTHLQAKKEKVHILPGSKSVPVFKWGKNIKDKEGKFVSEEDYHKMSEEQQKECTVYPYLRHFNEFNIDQTNYKEKYPEKYEKLLSNFVDPDRNKADTNGMYNNEALNKVIEEKDGWICPIVLDPSEGAAYSPGFNSIHIPPKENYRLHEGNAEETFKDGQEYYSTALHEMAHSTGHESVLKRDGIVKFDGFGSPSYAKEELVAELTAAMVSSTLGFDKRITENSAAYLKGWAAALRKEPKYIISVMSDVNKASRIELEHIDKQRKALGQKSLLEGTLDGLDEKADNEKQFEAIQNGETEKEQNNNIMDKKIFYSNLNANSDIELKEDPQQLVTLYENGDKQGLFDALKQAQKEAGAYWDLDTLQSTTGENAEIIAEDEKHIAVKYPEFTDTFFMFEKVTEQQILDKIQQQGLSEDDSEIAHQIGNEAVKKQFDGMRSHTLEMPNGTVLGVDYDPSTNEMLAGGITNAGLAPEHRSDYDHSITLDENLQNFSEELISMDEYQAQEEDIEEKVSEDQEENLSEENSEQKEEAESLEVSESHEETKEKVQDVDKKEYAAKEWSTIDNKLEMPSGDTLTVDYNKEKDTLDVLITTPEGKQEVYSTGYDHDHEAKANLGFVWEELSNMKQYQERESEKEVQAQSVDPRDEKKYYSSFAFMQDQEDTEQFDKLQEEGKYDEILNLASEYDQEQEIELEYVSKSSSLHPGDDLLAENEDYAVVYNNRVGGTYDLLKKYSENELREEIERLGGIGSNSSDAVKEIAYNMTADEFAAIQKEPVFEMPNGEILYFQYNKETDKIEVGTATNNGLAVSDTFMFERDKSVEANLANVYEEMSQREQYREQEPEEEQSLEEEKDIKGENTASISQGRAAASERSNDESYCYSFARFESSERTKAFDSYRESGDHEALLHLAEIMDVSNLIELNKVRKNAPKTSDDKVLVENSSYAVTFNQQNSTYDLLRKIEKEEVLELIGDINDNDEIKASSVDVQKLAYEDAAQQIADSEIPNVLTMPNGEKLDFQYSEERNQVDVGKMTPNGMDVQYIFDYDISRSPQSNISTIQDELAHLDEFQLMNNEEEMTTDNGQKAEVPHEDSLCDTNVVAEAKHIAATGVPIDKAEKMAKEKFEDINHENMHKEEERKSAEQEKKEAQQKEQQKKKEEEQKKENKNSNVVSSHAALLLAALVSSKNNNGVWLNPGFRKDAQFLFGNSPITGYNALMMNLHSEQNGYRSNIYTQYNPAKDNGMPIKEGEKAFYLSWTNWRYVKGAEDKQGISPKEYHSLDSKEKKMYQPRSERKVMNVWNIDQTTFAGKDYDAYVKVIKENGDQVESLNTIKEENIARAYSEVVKKHPDFVVLQLEDDVFKAYKKGAEKISKVTGIPMIKVYYLGKKVNSVEISKDKLDGYLSKIVNSGNQVVICDKPESPRLIKTLTKPEEVLQKANSLAKSVAKTEGLDYDREMVVRDAQYLPGEKKIVVSGMSDPGMDARSSAIVKANDIYRVLAAMTGTSDHLDRGGHVNLTPIDDVKYEKLVMELTAGVFMARQGLPATFSKESMELVPYWEREIKESPRMVSIIEKDVNNAVEVLDRLEKNIKPDYKKIVGMKAEKQMLNKSDYSIIKKINEFPNIDTKEIVVVKDTVNKKASVILPQGASLEKDNEVPGMRKDRIKNALSKEGFEVEKFYNAGGRLGLKQPNNYFADKEISVVRLHQYELVSNEKVDLSDLKKEVKFKIKDFQVLPDKEQGRYFFHIQAEGEKAFDIVPEKKYVNSFFKAIKSPDPEDKSKMIKALSEQFYKLGKAHPEMIVDLVSPRKVDVDMSRISSSHIYKSQEDPKIKYIKAVIDGQEHVKVIPADQYNKLFAAEDKPAYAKALAAVTFESLLKKGNTESVDNSQKDTNEKTVSKATPIEQSAVNKTVGQQEDNEHHQSMKFGRK